MQNITRELKHPLRFKLLELVNGIYRLFKSHNRKWNGLNFWKSASNQRCSATFRCKAKVKRRTSHEPHLIQYLTIRLFALDFYRVIVDEGAARVNYRGIEIESE